MNYLAFYGLEQEPFSNAPVTRFYFNSSQQQQALIRLNRVVQQMKGLAVLVGGIGTGKTTLARRMLDALPESEYEAALLVIIHSGITATWLLRRIAQQLGVQHPAQEKLQILSQLYRRLLELADSGKKAVVLIDEAQMLQTREIMEEFRGLLNLETPGRKLITFVFFGLPEIENNLKLDPPLMQRVAMRFHLDALDAPSCSEYIRHRLSLAGAKSPIFQPEALAAVYHYSQGIPRLINTLADNALFEGSIVKAKVIPREVVENIAVDLGLSVAQRRGVQNIAAAAVEAETSFAGLSEAVSEARVPLVSAPDERTPLHPFERGDTSSTEDIDSILSGLDEKF